MILMILTILVILMIQMILKTSIIQSSPRSLSSSGTKKPREAPAMHDTTLFAEMIKKKHLRDKLQARKSSKREDFEDTPPPSRVRPERALGGPTVPTPPPDRHSTNGSSRGAPPPEPPPAQKSRPRSLPGKKGQMADGLYWLYTFICYN